MALTRYMQLQFVKAVGVVVAGITSELNWIGDIQKLQLPFVCWTAFFNVIDMVETLQMLVSLTVKLKVGLQIGLVVAQLAD